MTSPMGNFSQGVYGDRMIGTTHRLLVWVDFQPALEIAIEPKGKDDKDRLPPNLTCQNIAFCRHLTPA